MNIIFFGSDDFALAHLEALIASGNNVVGCVTQPDKAKNRGMKIVISPIKECALKNNIKVFQPEDLKDQEFISALKKNNAELFVVIAYGKFLPGELIDMPQYGAINVHGSLLPKYRGAAPINRAIINGEVETGITIIKINSEMDAGDILSSRKIAILPKDTSATLREKMMCLGQKLLIETLEGLEKGTLEDQVQIQAEATFAPKLTKESGRIDWNKSAAQINNLVRGLQPWPGAYTFLNEKALKILSAEIVEGSGVPGEVIEIRCEGFVVAAAQGSLLVKQVHFQDSKPMDTPSFMRGHKIEVGYKFKP